MDLILIAMVVAILGVVGFAHYGKSNGVEVKVNQPFRAINAPKSAQVIVGKSYYYPDSKGRYSRRKAPVVALDGGKAVLHVGHQNNRTFPREVGVLRNSIFLHWA